MKHFFSILSLLVLANLSHAQYGKILSVLRFDNLAEEVKPDYGSLNHPIESGAFINMANPQGRNAGFVKLFNSYRWANGEKIDFSKRFSTKGGSKGIVDCYTLINPESKDTLKLYIDPYKTSEKYYVPEGLIAVNEKILKSEIEPILQQIEEINNAEDSSKLKFHIGDVMNYISTNFDQNQLVDLNSLEFVLQDKRADKDLTTFLMMIYVMNKYYALARDLDKEADYAFEKMKANYKRYIKVHPETSTGQLNEHLK